MGSQWDPKCVFNYKLQNYKILRGPQLGKQRWRPRLGILRVKHYSSIVSYVSVKCENDLWLMKLKWYERNVNGLIMSSNLAISRRFYKNIINLRIIGILGQTESRISGKWSSSADCNIQQDGKMIIISESGFGRSWSWLVSVLLGELYLHIQ